MSVDPDAWTLRQRPDHANYKSPDDIMFRKWLIRLMVALLLLVVGGATWKHGILGGICIGGEFVLIAGGMFGLARILMWMCDETLKD